MYSVEDVELTVTEDTVAAGASTVELTLAPGTVAAGAASGELTAAPGTDIAVTGASGTVVATESGRRSATGPD